MNVVVHGKAAKILTVLNKFRSNLKVPRISASSGNSSYLARQLEGKKVKHSYCSSDVYKKNDIKTQNNLNKFLELNKVDLKFNEEQYRRWYGVIHQYKSTRRSCYHLQQSLAEWYAGPGQYGQFIAQDRILREYIISFFGGYHEFRLTIGDVFVARSHGKIFLSGSYFKSAFDEWQYVFRGKKSVNSSLIHLKWVPVIRRHISQSYLQDKSTTLAWYSTLQWLQIQCQARTSSSLENAFARFVKVSATKYNVERKLKMASLRQDFSILNRLIESEYSLIQDQNELFDKINWLPLGWQSLKPKQSWVRPVFLEDDVEVRKNRIRSANRRVQFTVRPPMFLKKTGVCLSKHFARSIKYIKLHPSKAPISLSYGFISKYLNQALIAHIPFQSKVYTGVDNVTRTLIKLGRQALKISEKQIPVISLGVYCSPLTSNGPILRNSLKKYWQVMTSRVSDDYDYDVDSINKELITTPDLLISKLEKAFDSARFTAAFNRLKYMLNTVTQLEAPSLSVIRRAGKLGYLQNNISAAKSLSAFINMFTFLKRYAIIAQARVYPKIQYDDSKVLHFEQLYRQLEYLTGCQVFINMVSLRNGLQPTGISKVNSSMRSLYRIFHQQFHELSDQPGRLIWMEATPAIIQASHKDANLLLKLIIRAFKLTNYRHYNRFLALVKRYMSSVLSCLGLQTGFQGFKLLINGKLKRNPRSVEERILLGRMPLQSVDSRVMYSWQSVRRKRGVFGFKLWLYFGARRSRVVDKRKQFLLEQQQAQTPPQNHLNAVSWEHVNRHMQTPFWDSIRSRKNIPKWN